MAEMRIDNARQEEQRSRMDQCRIEGKCFFCETIAGRWPGRLVHQGKHWVARGNDFPYDGAVNHYLVVSRTHITDLNQIAEAAYSELFAVFDYLKQVLGVSGFSIFIRSGDLGYTSATLDHLHWHFVSGGPKIGTGPNKIEDLIIAPIGFKQKQE